MKPGHLGLPLAADIKGNQTFKFSPFPTAIIRKYAADHDIGKGIKANLLADSRFQKIDGKMLSTGTGSAPMQVDDLVHWFIFRANEHSIPAAQTELNLF